MKNFQIPEIIFKTIFIRTVKIKFENLRSNINENNIRN